MPDAGAFVCVRSVGHCLPRREHFKLATHRYRVDMLVSNPVAPKVDDVELAEVQLASLAS